MNSVIARSYSRWLAILVCLLLLGVAVRAITSWKNYGDLFTTSGVWTTIALDLADGTLYRPLISSLGYGGTRYAPLHPALQAALIHLGMGPITSGYLLAAIAVSAAVAGLFALMRQLGVNALVAICIACFALAANCFMQGITQIHGDPLALALELWGLTFIVLSSRRPASRIYLLLAAVLFMLAFAVKVTSMFGFVAAVAWLGLRGNRRAATSLAIAWCVGIILVVIVTQWASEGRAITIFRQTAAGGGGLSALLLGPRRFLDALFHLDRVAGGFWVLAIALILWTRSWRSLPALLLIVTTLGTIAILGSPGTGINHLMSLQAASILVIGLTLALQPRTRPAVVAALTVLVALGALNSIKQARQIARDRQRAQMQAVLEQIQQSPVAGPIYANDPFISILAHQRPYLLDGFMARLMRQKNAASADKLWDDMQHARFSACITHVHPTGWTDVVADDAMVASHLDQYTLKAQLDSYLVYVPRANVAKAP